MATSVVLPDLGTRLCEGLNEVLPIGSSEFFVLRAPLAGTAIGDTP